MDIFRGNILFSSVNQLEFRPTSRKDDLTSLSYLLLFLFNNCILPKFDKDFYEGKNVIENFNKMKLFKTTVSFRKMIKAVQIVDGNQRNYA